MIVRYEPGRTLMDAQALYVHLRSHAIPTIRKHCTPVTTDTKTGLQLYDADRAKDVLAKVKTRKRRRS